MEQLIQQILQQVSPELLLQIIALIIQTPPEQLQRLIAELEKLVRQRQAAGPGPEAGAMGYDETGMGNEQLFGPGY